MLSKAGKQCESLWGGLRCLVLLVVGGCCFVLVRATCHVYVCARTGVEHDLFLWLVDRRPGGVATAVTMATELAYGLPAMVTDAGRTCICASRGYGAPHLAPTIVLLLSTRSA